MSMTIPVIPALPAGHVVTLADMQALAGAATFLLGKPLAKVLDETGGVAIGTSPTTVTYTNVLWDTDGMWSSGSPDRLTIQTPGFYKLRYSVNCGAGNNFVAWGVVTTGSNNPRGAGNTSSPYWAGYGHGPAGGNSVRPGASGIWPLYLYQGDYMQLQVHCNATGNSTGNGAPGTATLGGSFLSLEYVSTG